MTQKTINAAKFKEQCLALLDEVDAEGIVITKHGKPVAKLIPIQSEHASMIGMFKGRLITDPNDDLLSTGVEWEAAEGIFYPDSQSEPKKKP